VKSWPEYEFEIDWVISGTERIRARTRAEARRLFSERIQALADAQPELLANGTVESDEPERIRGVA